MFKFNPFRQGSRAHPRLCDKDFLFQRALARDLKRAIGEIQRSDLVVLDVGSTYRPYESLFSGKYRRFLTVDLDPFPTVNLVGSADSLPVKSRSVDLCLCTQVLEHVERPEMVLKEAARVLRDDGWLLLSTHGVFHHHPFPNDYWRWTSEGLEKIILACFDSVRIMSNGGTVLLLFHIVGRGVFHVAEHRPIFRFLRYTVYPIINLAGMMLDNIVRQDALSLNYLAVARKQ